VRKASDLPNPPVVRSAHESATRWREGGALAQISRPRTRKPPVGTTFSFALNEAATVRFAFTQGARGRRVGGRCVAPTQRTRHKRQCSRTLTVATLTFAGHVGTNKVRFDGRVSRSKRLALGRFTLVITATNAAGQQSSPQRLTFTIVK
jgi:hypothetical protein